MQVSVFLFPRLFSAKSIIKVSVSLLRKLCIRIIIYLDDMLLMAASWEELLTAQDTVIYSIQDFLSISYQKSLLNPTPILEFLGVLVDSQDMILSLPTEESEINTGAVQEDSEPTPVSIRILSQLIYGVVSSAVAILPASLSYGPLQQQQICVRKASQRRKSLFQNRQRGN